MKHRPKSQTKNAAKCARYYAKHKERIKKDNAQYRTENPDKTKGWHLAYRLAYPEEVKEYHVEYRSDHKEEIDEWHRKNYEENAEEMKAAVGEYQRQHPEKKYLHDAKRRAAKYSNTLTEEFLTKAQWFEVLDEFEHCCAYCRKPFEHLTIDHVNPISRGGQHSKSNVVPACRSCNSKKSARTPEEWLGIGFQFKKTNPALKE